MSTVMKSAGEPAAVISGTAATQPWQPMPPDQGEMLDAALVMFDDIDDLIGALFALAKNTDQPFGGVLKALRDKKEEVWQQLASALPEFDDAIARQLGESLHGRHEPNT